jgi:pimeloyl-ACP methyl ester carboxylesterase
MNGPVSIALLSVSQKGGAAPPLDSARRAQQCRRRSTQQPDPAHRSKEITMGDHHATPPHESAAPLVTSRRGAFWIPGEHVATSSGTLQRGPMYVEWEAPERVTGTVPLVFVHGGGGQGTDWLATPDGRPGWAREAVAAGYATYVVDRVGHGRSPHHPATLGEPGGPAPMEMTLGVFAPAPLAESQTQWPWDRSTSDPVLEQLSASAGPMLQQLAEANELDARRLASLLDRIGPAVLVTHSLGAVSGWLAANRRPALVSAIVAVEPMGPPYVSIPGLGELTWGITSAPLESDPPAASPADLEDDRRIPGLTGKRIAVVSGSASPLVAGAAAVAGFLRAHGALAEHVRLEDAGVLGNGHGLVFERNSSATVQVVLDWIAALP